MSSKKEIYRKAADTHRRKMKLIKHLKCMWRHNRLESFIKRSPLLDTALDIHNIDLEKLIKKWEFEKWLKEEDLISTFTRGTTTNITILEI